MAGTSMGGKAAAATNKLKHGPDFYVTIGAKGGKISKHGGFASTKIGKDGLTGRQRASTAGVLGGQTSRRYKK